MQQRLCKDYGKYCQRAQVETSFSMLKRRLGAAVNARKYWSQCRELFLKVLTHNIMLLYAAAGFLQSLPDPFILPIFLETHPHDCRNLISAAYGPVFAYHPNAVTASLSSAYRDHRRSWTALE